MTESITSDVETNGVSYKVVTLVEGEADYEEITFGADPDNPCGAYYEKDNKKIITWIIFEGNKVERTTCDFDKDGVITTKDLLYAGMNYEYQTTVFDNLTDENKVKLQAY